MRRIGWMGLALLALLWGAGPAQAINVKGEKVNLRQRNRAIRSALVERINEQLPALEQKWGPMGQITGRDLRIRTKAPGFLVGGGYANETTVTYSIVHRRGWGGTAEARTRISGGEQTTTLFGFVLNVPAYAGPPPGAMSDMGPGGFGSAVGR